MNSDRLLTETRMTFAQLAQEQDVSLPTCWRWSSRGIKGHVLESFSVGIKKFTTREAFERWIARINGEPIPSRSNRQCEREKMAAKRNLHEAGLIE
jgi:hypothetical protein